MKESEVRDYLVDNFSNFRNFIINLNDFKKEIEETENKIKTNTSKRILISDLITIIVIDKLKQSFPYIENLKLLDKEYTLLNTDSGRGKQPAIDIMAYNDQNYSMALLELKISDSAEREAITELSAYNQGLQNKYRGLSSMEVLWIPISTEWRVTTKSAIEFEIFWKNTLVLPLKMQVDYNDNLKKVNSVELNCFNPTNDINEIECLNIFSDECFEAFDYCTMAEIPDKNAFINYVSAICSRKKINGFIIFHKPVNMMYPYGFTLCIYNPYKGYLHKRISVDFVKVYGIDEFNSCLKDSGIINTNHSDIDLKLDVFKSWESTSGDMEGKSLKYDSYWKKDFLSVGDFAENTENSNINYLFETIKSAIDSNKENKRAIGTPDFKGLFNTLNEDNVDSIMYLGIYQELISERIKIQHSRNIHQDDFFTTTSSFSYLKSVFDDYNPSE